MSAVNTYIQEFYLYPKTIDEYKINFLKNHFYCTINLLLRCEFKNFKIGVNNNKHILWFIDCKNPNIEIIYNHKNNLYFKRNKNVSDVMEKIDISKYYDSISQESEINYLSENKEFNQNSNEHSKRKNLNCFPECVIC
jgi:hypothetical protein